MGTFRFDLTLTRQRDDQAQATGLEQEVFNFEDCLYQPSWLRTEDEHARQG
ncbi:MAG: hypothetical protein ACOH5I_13665 [Oligoflexus sp.]